MAENRCPTCGQLLPERKAADIQTVNRLIEAMREPPPPGDGRYRSELRDVYEGYNKQVPTGRFYVTYSGLTVAREAVEEAVRRGLIVLSWPHITTGSWSLPEQAKDNRRKYVRRAGGR